MNKQFQMWVMITMTDFEKLRTETATILQTEASDRA